MNAASPLAFPNIPPVQADNVPTRLKAEKRWLAWKAGPLKPSGKFDKIPVDPRTGRNIDGRDEKHWVTFTVAMNAHLKGVANGVGFALSDRHPILVDGVEFYVTVADFDQCGTKMDECRVLWLELGQPFTEVSPSKTGLHMWGLSRLPLRGGNSGGGKELYSGGRFLTMTGIDAIGSFGECPGFASLEQLWFPPQPSPATTAPRPPVVVDDEFPSNIEFNLSAGDWFARLSSHDKNACLAEMLQVPAVIALADQPDDAPSSNWRTVVAACARSDASDACNLCRTWAQTSKRFDADNFDLRWGSYARG